MMNETDQKDYSVFRSFFEDETAFVSNAVIMQMLIDLCNEIQLRESSPQHGESE